MATFVGSIIITGMTSQLTSSWRANAIMLKAKSLDEAVGKCHRYAREQNLFPEIKGDRVVDAVLMEITSASPITVVKTS